MPYNGIQYLFTPVTPPLVDTPPDPAGSPGSRECVECPVGSWAAVGGLQCIPCGVGDCSQCVSVVSLVPGRTFRLLQCFAPGAGAKHCSKRKLLSWDLNSSYLYTVAST